MRRALACCLFIGLLFCLNAGISSAQVLNNDISRLVLNKDISAQALDSLPGKKTPVRAARPQHKSPARREQPQTEQPQSVPPRAVGRSPEDPPPAVEQVGLADLKRMLQEDSGKVVLLNAWASWCKPCADEMPGLLKACRLFRGEPLRLILLSTDDLDDLETKVRPALKKFGIDFTTYVMSDSNEDAFISGINDEWTGALPTTFFYDRKGNLAEMKVGERSYQQFKEALERLLRR